MREYEQVRQIPGEHKRRWFSSPDMDLFVWTDDAGNYSGFELCYDKSDREHAISWRANTGFSHAAVDDGENRPGRYKSTPIHVADGYFDAKRIHSSFKASSASLPQDIVLFVLSVLEKHPGWSE